MKQLRAIRAIGAVLAAALVVNALPGVTALAADPHSQAEAEQYIKSAEAAWAQSVATNDSSVEAKILADDVVWVLDGEVLNKAQAVEGAAKGPVNFDSNHLEYAHVKSYGDTAVVQGSEMWKRKDGNKGRFVWVDTWVRRNGQWQIVGAADVRVPVKK